MSNQNSNNAGSTGVKLSYSSMKTLQTCEQKYHHYKIQQTPYDPDYTESDALGLGKAFHAVLERTLHQDYNDALIIEAMVENNVDPSEKDLLTVMIRKYVEFRKASGIKVIKCELPIATSSYVGFIDYIAVKGDKWYIGDLKTAGRHDEKIFFLSCLLTLNSIFILTLRKICTLQFLPLKAKNLLGVYIHKQSNRKLRLLMVLIRESRYLK
jgi:hypothetical protein